MSIFARVVKSAIVTAVLVSGTITAPSAYAADEKSSRYAYLSCFNVPGYRGHATYEECFEFYKAQYQAGCNGFSERGEKYCY